ncbi:hypothetical protein Dimus_011803 [Dionaea muscipula]
MDKATSWQRAQRLYEQNRELETKRQKSAQARVPSDPNAWSQIRENYEAIVLEDHAFAERYAIEYDLWQLHYRRIEEFRAHLAAAQAPGHALASSRGRNPSQADRTIKIRVQFKNFLSEATGFYHELIVKICSKYGFPLAQLSGDLESHVISGGDGAKSSDIYKGLVSCHRCLVYLGDLARYKALYGENGSRNRDFTAASRYYLQAASLLPSSGNPHNQLAILASYSGDDLVTIYRYVRSLAAESPFTNAKDNLVTAFEKNRHNYNQQHGKFVAPQAKETGGEIVVKSTREKYREFCIEFVRLNGMLFTCTSLEAFSEVLSLVKSSLHELLSSGPEEEQNFGVGTAENGLAILRLVAILIFIVYNSNRKTEGLTYAETLQQTILLHNVFVAIFELVGLMLERILELRDPSSSFILPGVLAFLEWLACSPDVAARNDTEEKPKAAKLIFWKHCIAVFNKLLSDGVAPIDDDGDETCFTEMTRYEEGESESRRALWEDFELRGFLPLLPAQTILDFSRRHSTSDGGSKEKITRLKRILAAGKALLKVVVIDKQPVHFDSKTKQFVVGIEPQRFVTPVPNNFMPNGSLNPGVMQVKTELFSEGGEEEEEIVFRPPPPTDKQMDANGLGLALPEQGDVRFQKPWSDARSNLGIHMGTDSPQPPLTVGLPMASWLVDQQHSVSNSLKNLSLMKNGHAVKSEGRGGLGTSSDVGALLPPFPPPSVSLLNNGATHSHSGQTRALEVGLSSRADSFASSSEVNGIDVASTKTDPTLPAASKYHQLGRPVRRIGPPPGFNPVPQKQVHIPLLSNSDGRNESLLMDDIGWLHGSNQMPSMNDLGQGLGPIKNANYTMMPNNMLPISNTTNILNGSGIPSFPFPGKQQQVSAVVQMQGTDLRGYQNNYQPFGNLNPSNDHKLLEQQHALMSDQQSSLHSEHHHGQTAWTGQHHRV